MPSLSLGLSLRSLKSVKLQLTPRIHPVSTPPRPCLSLPGRTGLSYPQRTGGAQALESRAPEKLPVPLICDPHSLSSPGTLAALAFPVLAHPPPSPLAT